MNWKWTITTSLVLLTAGIGRGASIQLSPVVDGDIARHVTFGFTVNTTAQDIAANLNPANDLRGFLEFSFASIPRESLVTSATLQLYVWHTGGMSNQVGTFELHGYVGDGAITTDDFDNDIHLLQTFRHTVGTFGNRDFDVTALVRDRVTAGDAYGGFLFKALSQNILVGFGSNEHPSRHPVLDVQFTPVPEPATATLLILFAGVAALCRRRLLVPKAVSRRP